ncbi:MAG TPA: biotin/lipoyl-containing protein [Candidatus Binatia bacterium]|nr:biotin/lipoyl-containing protein [Candidatus Binatia bacterium]
MNERYSQETETLRELLEIMREHDLDTIKVKLGDAVYELSRRSEAGIAAPQYAAAPVASEPRGGADGANATKVLAPLTGVFYRAASPDATAYVEVGDRVEAGSVLCVLEAMKLFNEIQSDYAGTIVRVVPENGELVSQGDELFWIEP